MVDILDLARACPSCGKRLHVRLVKEEIVDDLVTQGEVTGATGRGPSGHVIPTSENLSAGPFRTPAAVDTEVHLFSYQCGACGHTWSERRSKTDLIGGDADASYTGD